LVVVRKLWLRHYLGVAAATLSLPGLLGRGNAVRIGIVVAGFHNRAQEGGSASDGWQTDKGRLAMGFARVRELVLLLLSILILLRRRLPGLLPLRLPLLLLDLELLLLVFVELTLLPSLVRQLHLPARLIRLGLIVLSLVVVSCRLSVGIVAMVQLLLLQLWLLLLAVGGHACFFRQLLFVFSPLLALYLCAAQLNLRFGPFRCLCCTWD
jgi:hypothetical protein